MGNKAFQLTLKSHICFNVYVEDLKNKPQLAISLALKVHFSLSVYCTDMQTSIRFGQDTQENKGLSFSDLEILKWNLNLSGNLQIRELHNF